MRISVNQLRKKLVTGTEFTAEFMGKNTIFELTMAHTRRRVVSCNTVSLVSTILDGPKIGQKIYLNWKGVTVDHDGDRFTLTQDFGDGSEVFLAITLDPEGSSVAV